LQCRRGAGPARANDEALQRARTGRTVRGASARTSWVARFSESLPVRTDHRPFWLKRVMTAYHRAWAERFLCPQFDAVGTGLIIFGPKHVEVNGSGVRLGHNIHMMATRDAPIRFTCYAQPGGLIELGDCSIVLPGVRLSSATRIRTGKNCMFATHSYVTDADWHDLYDRTSAPGGTEEVVPGDNVWIGDSAIVCKGVTIGDNTIVGAGAVVASDLPADAVAVGNPARVVKQLDPSRGYVTRDSLFSRDRTYERYIYDFEKWVLHPNTLRRFLRSRFAPTRED
jgi:acetyltransferase-like isoleucine patch superfamily enzyme